MKGIKKEEGIIRRELKLFTLHVVDNVLKYMFSHQTLIMSLETHSRVRAFICIRAS